jgi:Ni,Fe-hydrogenase I cytochrome b subunit
MKSATKFMLYSIVIVILTICSLILFKNHPEVQLSFLLPGIFIMFYSKIRDEIYVNDVTRLRMARGR